MIQPQVLLQLPCYDFTPIMDHTVTPCPPIARVSAGASSTTHFRDVTGGVYKTRERIHRDIADSRLLAIPTSRSRVADSDPDYDGLYGIGFTLRLCNPLYPPL